jgi:tetratricopeptide (TPR) repeat protein
VQTLYLNITDIDGDYAQLRYSWGQPGGYESQDLDLGIIQDLIQQARRDYYMPEREDLDKTAAQTLYHLWWEVGKSEIEEQRREMHRLALRGNLPEMAAEMAFVLSKSWQKQSRFREALQLCESTLTLTQDYRVMHQLARSKAELGEVSAAKEHYQQALASCPEAEEQEKATIIHNLADNYRRQGEIDEAISLYQRSLELKRRIGYVQGEAATLHQLAIIHA